jgi:hypothetical protein
VVAVPTYPLTARYGSWPGGYLRDIDDQGVDLAFILEELIDLPFVDADRIGLTGVSAGGFTSLLTAFHESGFDGTVQGVATEIARPLTAPNELNVPIGAADVPLFMSNNVDDRTTVFGPADAFWQDADLAQVPLARGHPPGDPWPGPRVLDAGQLRAALALPRRLCAR